MSMELGLLLVAVFAPGVVLGVGVLLREGWVLARVLVSLGGMAASVGALGWYALREGGASESVWVMPFVPALELDLAFRADALGLFFGLLVSGMGCLIVLYARGYFGTSGGADAGALRRFYPALGLFATAMMGLVLSDGLLSMFVFWELTGLSSFLLIGWHRERGPAVRAALQALVITGLGGMLLLAGVLAVGVSTGEWSFSGLEAGGHGVDGLFVAGFVLMFAGGAAKSAQWPVHFWLPGAMAAPTPVSAYLHSATMVKAGVYLFARVYPLMGELAWWTPMLVTVGGTTMVVGAYLALRSDVLKRVFAYATVSQLGLLVCAYGVGGMEFSRGGEGEATLIYPVTQILNHALYKAPLFMIAGALMHRYGRRRVGDFVGLLRRDPVLGAVGLCGLWAMAGMPFSLSFTAKEAFFYQVAHAAAWQPWFWVVGAMGVFTAVCNVAIFVRFVRVFVSRPGGAGGEPKDHGHGSTAGGFWAACMWWPAALLVGLQLFGGVAPAWFWLLMRGVETHVLYWEALPGMVHAVTRPSAALAMSGVAIVCGIVVGLSDVLRRPVLDVHGSWYVGLCARFEGFGGWVFRTMQSGNLRTYLLVVLTGFVVALGWAVGASDTVALLSWPEVAPLAWAPGAVKIAALLLTGLICVSSLVLPAVQVRAVRVLILGIAGFSVTGMYIVYAAPDLALTQIMFEIVSVVLFLMALRLLPERITRRRRGWIPARVAFSAVVGVTIGWVVLHAGAEADRVGIASAEAAFAGELTSAGGVLTGDVELVGGVAGDSDPRHPAGTAPAGVGGRAEPLAVPDRLGGWFLRNSYEGVTADSGGRGGGGENVVNVILVDFRGYDTMGEITVLAITLMGVLALLGSVPVLRSAGVGGERAATNAQPHLGSFMLRSAMLLLLPLIFLFSGYVFMKGHNEPGGGFIAGLASSVGLAAYRMTAGNAALHRLLPVKPGVLASIGLAIALSTGVAPMVIAFFSGGSYGGPFLMSDNAYIALPGGGEFHWTSVLLFDLGVFMVVIAATVGIVNRFEEELE